MRVLILAYDFPPYVSVGGFRPYSWYRYLKEFGVEPVVVTRQWANHYGDERDYIAPSATDRVEVERTAFGTIVRAPYRPNLSHRLLLEHGRGRYRFLRKAITAWYEIGQYYADIGPKAPVVQAARGYLRDHSVDAIVATGGPFVLFRYAAALSSAFKVPWIADYRDPWSQDRGSGRLPFSRLWAAGLEKRLVASASLVTTVTESFGRLLAELHPGKPVHIVPNGYDPEAVAAAEGVPQGRERLTIAFTGTVSPWHPVESVFRVLDEFVATEPRPPVRLHLIGVGEQARLERLLQARFPALAAATAFTRRLSNADLARKLAEANVFLLFNMYAHPGTKIYDYLALHRTTLLCYAQDPEALALKRRHYSIDPPPGADERVLERIIDGAGAGLVVRDASHLAEVLRNLHREFALSGTVACRTRGEDQYSRRTHAGALAKILQEMGR